MKWLCYKSSVGLLFSTLHLLFATPRELAAAGAPPVISSIAMQNNRLILYANVPAGYGHVVLEAGADILQGFPESLVAGGLSGGEAIVSFSVPVSGALRFMKI